jgi:hypothetical protein
MKLNLLDFNENIISYRYPIIKIITSVVLIIILVNRTYFIHFEDEVFNIILGVIATAVGCVCILCIYISWAEISLVHENRKKTNIVIDSIIANTKKYSIDEIVAMSKNNDIIDIQIVVNDKAIGIGSSSDCKAGSSKFFDKLYYIDKNEFANIDDFKASLLSHTVNEKIMVISIDGIRPE